MSILIFSSRILNHCHVSRILYIWSTYANSSLHTEAGGTEHMCFSRFSLYFFMSRIISSCVCRKALLDLLYMSVHFLLICCLFSSIARVVALRGRRSRRRAAYVVGVWWRRVSPWWGRMIGSTTPPGGEGGYGSAARGLIDGSVVASPVGGSSATIWYDWFVTYYILVWNMNSLVWAHNLHVKKSWLLEVRRTPWF
jgi:hypothetical protein